MTTRDALEEQFSCLGVDVDEEVLIKCEDLCLDYDLDEENLVATWMAFSITHLGGAEPTLETLAQMERKQLVKRDTPKVTSKLQSLQTSPSPLVIYNASHLDPSLRLGPNEDMLEAYNTYATPKTRRVSKYANGDDDSPDSGYALHTKNQFNTPGRSPLSTFSPASYCSISEQSQRYSGRSNAGEIKLHFSPNARECTWTPSAESSFFPKIGLYNPDFQLKSTANFMFEKVLSEVAYYDDQMDFFGQQIMEKHGLVDPEPCGVAFQEPIVTYGRILIEKFINGGKGALLEGTRMLSRGLVVDLELGAMEYSLFPGQVCVVKATNPTGSKLVVESIYTSANLPLPSSLPQFTTKEGPLQLVVAAGPFTQLDTLNCQPLEDLIKYIIEHKPHVVILIGPFIDVLHPHILDEVLAETYESLFEKMIEQIMDPLKSLQTQVVMVPSCRDMRHDSIYPTPPCAHRKTPSNMHFMSDPSTFSIQGLVVGVTSIDIIKDLSASECAKSSGAVPRLHRLASHVLSQQCFYPLYPPPLGLNIDVNLFGAFAQLEITPHILILPSELRHFAFVSEGCLVLNPEHLSRGMIGGTFARLEVPPPSEVEDSQAFVNSISCDIISI